MAIELHQAVGTNYKTWAAGPVSMKGLLAAEGGKIFGKLDLHGVTSEAPGILFAQLQFTIQFKVPVQKALALYNVIQQHSPISKSNKQRGKTFLGACESARIHN